MQAAGEAQLDAYLRELFEFTLLSFASTSQTPGNIVHANKLGTMWQRILLEGLIQEVPCVKEIEENIWQIIGKQMDAMLQTQYENEDIECFDVSEKTSKSDDIDSYSKLMKAKMGYSLPLLLEKF